MPNEDRYHPVVLRCLQKAGWSIIKEQVYISVGKYDDTNRRLYIDIKAQRYDDQLALIEVKGLERSPVHELMELLGQYLMYRIALDYLSIELPLYIALPENVYKGIIQHVLGQEMMTRYAIPLLIFDPVKEEIVKWIPEL
ncbi:MAG: element excision factor XisH family protein [Aggregatilineales bacterium]